MDPQALSLFEENEDLLHLFEKFGELHTFEAQATSTELAEHATKVMRTLDEGVKGLKDIDGFYAYVRHIGATHHQVPGFKAENFWVRETFPCQVWSESCWAMVSFCEDVISQKEAAKRVREEQAHAYSLRRRRRDRLLVVTGGGQRDPDLGDPDPALHWPLLMDGDAPDVSGHPLDGWVAEVSESIPVASPSAVWCRRMVDRSPGEDMARRFLEGRAPLSRAAVEPAFGLAERESHITPPHSQGGGVCVTHLPDEKKAIWSG
ncbi:hypothetical protein evm_000129 [Chilo suppressalis]|nr:hypothetical protein evm_000129 [Chilo suppressalis]